MARGRDEENTIYPCMALPTDVHRVHAPDEDPRAHGAGATSGSGLRDRLRRLFRRHGTTNAAADRT